ncbi:Nif3-like dinuclear metal center hexameric protein [Chitinasiproducens palmae]|uniref:GTP cyclohydrolase 1 type 2 homolog n=1 Tax=Chitinasiproducens palmae TaxID=1770053 RepID=A0A1H2PVE8_9BURK|nr:Nif3-like dinuclear metal center hexameric protein [Chitinasiproducens palmae]SDV51265.1 dinuclear metal center protein, YbgI/SA1388 family [Chitinasiproducens palmae]
MDRNELELYLNNLLETGRFRDYCPNGLQVEGRRQVERIATGVTASQEFLEAALEWGADAVLVHHGYFWKNEPAPIRGIKHRRLRTLLTNDINLFAYHLPLDDHPEFGNNAQLGKQLGFIADARFGDNSLGWQTSLAVPLSVEALRRHIENVLGRTPLVLGPDDVDLRRIGWCTGGAQGYFADAIEAGVDAFISGEVSEQTTHLARETGVVYFAAGHHATERYGVQALGDHLADTFEIEHNFFDIDNPV